MSRRGGAPRSAACYRTAASPRGDAGMPSDYALGKDDSGGGGEGGMEERGYVVRNEQRGM